MSYGTGATTANPDVRIRPYAGPPDHTGLQAVRSAVRDGDGWFPGPDDPDCSPDQRATCLVAEVTDGSGKQIVGYTWLDWWTEVDSTRVYLLLGWVAPAWLRRGIGGALLTRQEEQASALARRQPGSGPIMLGTNAAEDDPETAALLHRHGYRLAFTVVTMTCDPAAATRLTPPPTLPTSIDLRTVAETDHPRIHQAIEECFTPSRTGYVPRSFAEYQRDVRERQHDTDLWRVAWAGDEVAGVVISEIRPDGTGHTPWVAVREPWRRRGLGRALVYGSLCGLADRRVPSAELSTVAENPHRSVRFYEGLGYQVIEREPRYRKPLPLSS
ncbi:GNAT family N-acetyltransferase [Actinopolymorpha alba]|uniref:GNAT family N-acetyltransferase n=1 Tax=Actinopolymorpha alba TaxID=533267 RepID=UPI00037633D0|nr:GNAT family N-acetyltransferase [Actinopolymorpha alba]